MVILLVCVILVALFLTNGGWTWIQNQLELAKEKTQAGKLVDKTDNATQPESVHKVPINAYQPIFYRGGDESSKLHDMIDNWVELCHVPGIADDPAAVAAMRVIEGKILMSVMPVQIMMQTIQQG